MTATQERREKYWKKFHEYLQEKRSFLQSKETFLPEQWHTIKLAKWVHIEVIVNKKGNRVEVYFTDSKEKNKQRFNLLERDFKMISMKEIDIEIEWLAMPDNKLSKVMVVSEHLDFEKEETWDDQFKWLMVNAERMHTFFAKKLNDIEKNNFA